VLCVRSCGLCFSHLSVRFWVYVVLLPWHIVGVFEVLSFAVALCGSGLELKWFGGCVVVVLCGRSLVLWS